MAGRKASAASSREWPFARDRAVDALRAAHEVRLWLMDDLTLTAWNPKDSRGPASLAWIVSHLTAYYAFCSANLGVPSTLPAAYRIGHPTMFDDSPAERAKRTRGGRATAPASIAAGSLLRLHRARFADLVSTAESLTAAQLAAKPAGSMAEYASDKLACLERAAWHEGWHTAHVAELRRKQGLAPKF
jgi:hypothetical protein